MLCFKSQIIDVLLQNTQRKQVVLGLTGVLLGLSGGLIFKGRQLDEDISGLLSVPGEILLRMYKVLTLPLVVSSVISGKELFYSMCRKFWLLLFGSEFLSCVWRRRRVDSTSISP